MAPTDHPSAEELVICEPEGGAPNAPPDLRFLHYNDVYHVEAGSREPVGGYARFQTLVNYYRDDGRFKGQPKLLTFFSGDAFNPSIESSITKGQWAGLPQVMQGG
jgi:2',3'-cyclic-nucleotide 2'-phosphodiesterase (5'-nucleotidase family)